MPTKEDLLVKAAKPSQDALRLHPFYRGKIQVMSKCPVRNLADFAVERGLGEEYILPRMDEWEVVPRVAVATAVAADRQGLAALHADPERLHADAVRRLRDARASVDALFRAGLIAPPPD